MVESIHEVTVSALRVMDYFHYFPKHVAANLLDSFWFQASLITGQGAKQQFKSKLALKNNE